MLLILTMALGLGPVFLVSLVPQLVGITDSPYALELAVPFMVVVPIGISYNVMRYQSVSLHRLVEPTLVPIAVFIASFVVGSMVFGYLSGDVETRDAGVLWRSVVMGLTTGAVGAVVATMLGVSSRRRQAPLAPEGPSGRNAILMEMHDGPVQTATALSFHVWEDPNLASSHVGEFVNKLIREMRLILRLGRVHVGPEGILDPIVSLENLIREVETLSPVPVVFTHSNSHRREKVSPEMGRQIYTVVQQALSNVLRHSGAPEATLHLEFGEESVSIGIRDNGTGFDSSDWESHPEYFGLQEMRWRT